MYICISSLQIRLIDIGAICIVDVNQLLTLPSQFMTTPPLVIEAFVCGLIAHDKDIDWSPEVCMYTCTCKYVCTCMYVYMYVIYVCTCMYVCMYVYMYVYMYVHVCMYVYVCYM